MMRGARSRKRAAGGRPQVAGPTPPGSRLRKENAMRNRLRPLAILAMAAGSLALSVAALVWLIFRVKEPRQHLNFPE